MQKHFFTELQAGEQVKGNITEQSTWEWNHSQTCTLLTNLKPTLESLLPNLNEGKTAMITIREDKPGPDSQSNSKFSGRQRWVLRGKQR